MELTINGEMQRVDAPLTLAGLVDRLRLDPRKLAVERNREIVPRSSYSSTALAPGDVLEIVHFVGGG